MSLEVVGSEARAGCALGAPPSTAVTFTITPWALADSSHFAGEKIDQLICGHKVLEGYGRRPWLVQVSVC